MILYHGTSEFRLPNIIQSGIDPRSVHRVSNWEHSIESNPKAVYLTDAYALYFAYASIQDDETDRLLVFEIDTEKLKQNHLCADEDAVAQANYGRDLNVLGMDLIEATKYYRKHIRRYPFETSLEVLGTCAYIGTIPVDAIRRVAFVTQKVYVDMIWMGHDPTISIMNYQVIGDKYRNALKWLFDPESITVEETEVAPGMISRSVPVPKTREGIKVRLMKDLIFNHILDSRSRSNDE